MRFIYQFFLFIGLLTQMTSVAAQDCSNAQLTDPLYGFIPDNDPCCGAGLKTICYDFSDQSPINSSYSYGFTLFEHPNGIWTGYDLFYSYGEIADKLNAIGQANGLNVNFQWNAADQTICSSTSSIDYGDIGYRYADVATNILIPPIIDEAALPCPSVIEPDADILLNDLTNNSAPSPPAQIFPGDFGDTPILLTTSDVSNGGTPSTHIDPDTGEATEYSGPTANQVATLLNSGLSGLQSGAGCSNYNCIDLSAMMDLFLSDPDNVTAINDAADESGQDVPGDVSLAEYLATNSNSIFENVSLADLMGSAIGQNLASTPCPDGNEMPPLNPFTDPEDAKSGKDSRAPTAATPKTDADQDYFSSDIAGLGLMGSGSTPPSPSAMETIEGIKGGVNLYNGSQNSRIPLYSLQANDINIPITINSSNNGLKVDDLGSLVGQNWNMEVGGSISRVVKGFPDEFVGEINSRGVGQIHKIRARFEPFSNAGIELKITGAGNFGCSLIKLKSIIKDIGFEKNISGNSPVKVTWSWTPLRPNLVNFTIGFPIQPLPWLTIYVQAGFNVGISLNKGFGDINFDEEAQGFLSIDNGAMGIPSLNSGGAQIHDLNNNNDRIDMLERVNGNRSIDDLTFFNDNFGQYSNWLNAIEDLTQGQPTYNSQKADSQPDEFHFTFGNYSGKFSFNPNESIVMFPYYKGLEIIPFFVTPNSNSSNRIIKGFTVNTPDGMQYKFGDHTNNSTSFRGVDKTKSTDYTLPNSYTYPELKVNGKGNREQYGQAKISMSQLKSTPFMGNEIVLTYGDTYERNYTITNSPEFTSTWHLVKIKSNISQESVILNYQNRNLKYYSGKNYSHTFPNFSTKSSGMSGSLKTEANSDLNPRLLYNGIPTKWENGKANFTYSASEIELSRWHLTDVFTDRGESVHFKYNCERGEIFGDKVCNRIEVRRGDIGAQGDNPIYKGWQLVYETKETGSSSSNCNFETSTMPLAPAVSIGGETKFNLGERYNLKWTELENASYFFLNFRIACFAVPLRFVLPFNKGVFDFGHRTHLSEFGSLMDVKLLNEGYLGTNTVAIEKEETIFNAERRRTFLKEIKELGKSANSNSTECNAEGYPLVTIDYKGNIDNLPKRFSTHQDRFGYHIDNSISGSPFPSIEYTSILGTEITSQNPGVSLHFGFFNEDASGGIHNGQADYSNMSSGLELAQVGSIDQITFASGGFFKYDYELNELPTSGLGAGLRVSQLVEDPYDSPAKTTNYFYEKPTVVLAMDRISQNPYNYYYRHPENGFSFEKIYEEKVRTTSSPQNEMFSNKSNYVGYYKVTEQWDDIGSIVHYFTIPEDCSGGGGSTFTSNNNQPEETNNDCKNIKESSYEHIKKRRVYLNNYDVQSQDFEEEVPGLRFPKIGYKSWKLGLETLTEVFNNDGTIRQRTTNSYNEYKDEAALTLNYFKSEVYQHNFQGTFWQNYVYRLLSSYKPFGEKIDENGNETTNGSLDELLNLLVSLIKGTLVNHPFKEIELNYMVSDRKLSTGNMRMYNSYTQNYFSSGSNSSSLVNDYTDSPFPNIPKRIISSAGSQTTINENIFRTDAGEVEIAKFDQPTLDYLESLNFATPLASRVYLSNGSTGDYNLIKRDFSVLTLDPDNPSIMRLVPKESYTYLGEDETVAPLLVGKFSNYNVDGKPQLYKLAKFDGTYFDDITMSWNSQFQLLTRTYKDYTTSNTFNNFFELETTTDPDNIQSRFTFDQRGRLSETIAQITSDATEGRQIFTFSYSIEPGNNTTTSITTFVDEIHPPQGIISKTDGLGKELNIIRTADGSELTAIQYDNFFRPISTYSIGQGSTQVEYEASPIPFETTTTDAVGNITISKNLSGGAFFSLKEVTDPNGHITHTFSDGVGKTRKTVEGVGSINSITSYKFDPWGRLGEIINSEGESYLYDYNEIGQLSQKKVPGASASSIIWDVAYRPIAIKDGNGNTQVMSYDDYNRIIRISKANVSFANLNSVVAENAFSGNETDILIKNVYHEESGQTRSWIATSYERIIANGGFEGFKTTNNIGFDGIGRPSYTYQNYPEGTVKSVPEYSDAGLIQSMITTIDGPGDAINFDHQYTYDGVLRQIETSLGINGAPNQKLSKVTYNGIDQMTSKLLGGTGTYLSDPDQFLQMVNYTYDAAGKLIYINSPSDAVCLEDQEFCYLEAILVIEPSLNETCATITGILIGGTPYLFPTNVDLFNLNNGALLENYIKDILDSQGYFGDVEVIATQPTSGPNRGNLVYTILINHVNVSDISLIATSTCKDKMGFSVVSCCDPDNSNSGDSNPAGSTTNGDLYYQQNTYTGLDISRIELASDCVSGRIRNDYTYDALHRITSQVNTIFKLTGEVINDRYTATYDFDKVGNITKLIRNGWISQTAEFGVIDVLEYTYNNSNGSASTLLSIEDLTEKPDGFRHNPDALPTDKYAYDGNGSLTFDPYKELSINYNILNLPEFISGDGVIKIKYTAKGEKLKKTTSENGQVKERVYISGMEYLDEEAQFYSTDEGRVVFDEDENHYQYRIADHLGNTVVLFEDLNLDGDIVTEGSTTAPVEVLQRNLYYPFGLELGNAVGIENTTPAMSYLYNGMEFESDLGLNWSDYGARMYDGAIGRWGQIDPLAATYAAHSPYNYVLNKPTSLVDPTGMSAEPPEGGYEGQEYSDDSGDYYHDGEEWISLNLTAPEVFVTSKAPAHLWKLGDEYYTQHEVFELADHNPWLEKKILRGGFDSEFSDPIASAYFNGRVRRSVNKAAKPIGLALALPVVAIVGIEGALIVTAVNAGAPMIYPSVAANARNLIANAEQLKAIDYLLKQRNLSKAVIKNLQKLRKAFKKNFHKDRLGIRSYEKFTRKTNKLTKKLLDLITKHNK